MQTLAIPKGCVGFRPAQPNLRLTIAIGLRSISELRFGISGDRPVPSIPNGPPIPNFPRAAIAAVISCPRIPNGEIVKGLTWGILGCLSFHPIAGCLDVR
jgi:hypothetical protein